MSGKKCLVLSILLAAMLTGCGGRMNYAATDLPVAEPLSTSQTGTAAVSTPNNTDTTTNPYNQAITTVTAVNQGSLEIRDVTKDTKGVLLWKKLVVKGRVYNASHLPLSATLQVVFSKSNVVGGTQIKEIRNLVPGQSLSFEFTSVESADAGELSIVGQR